MSSNGAGGWAVGDTSALNQFVVAVTAPALTLSGTYQALAASVVPYGSLDFLLTYTAPSADNIGGGVDQSFTITLRASAAP